MKLLATFLAVLLLLGVPVVVAIVVRSINVTIWKLRLVRRLGALPPEIYVPEEVRQGCAPLGFCLAGAIPAGLALAGLGHWISSESLLYVGAALAMTSVGLLVVLSVASSIEHGPFGAERRARTKTLERAQGIERLSKRIQAAGESSLASLYWRLWRARYRLDGVSADHDAGRGLDYQGLSEVRADLDVLTAHHLTEGHLRKQLDSVMTDVNTLEAASRFSGGSDYFARSGVRKGPYSEPEVIGWILERGGRVFVVERQAGAMAFTGPREIDAATQVQRQPGKEYAVNEVRLRGVAGLSDDDLQRLRAFPYLHCVDLSETNITDVGLSQLFPHRYLRRLILRGTAVSPDAVAGFRATRPFCEVDLGGS